MITTRSLLPRAVTAAWIELYLHRASSRPLKLSRLRRWPLAHGDRLGYSAAACSPRPAAFEPLR